MRILGLIACAAAMMVIPNLASAATLTYNSWAYTQNYGTSASGGAGDATCSVSGQTNSGGLTQTNTSVQCEQELEEHNMYAWKIAGVGTALGTDNIVSAT